jgi:hypothetical protein
MYLPDFIAKYISKQQNDSWKIHCNSSQIFKNIIVVPAIDEYDYLKDLIHSLQMNDRDYLNKTFLLFVINNKLQDDSRIISENMKTIKYLKREIADCRNGLNIGLIDASSHGKELPSKFAGVGFARKLGMDKALEYFDYKSNNKNIILSLDADCKVSSNYLRSVIDQFNNSPVHAAVVDFEHIFPEDLSAMKAIINYEIFLRYYVLGLRYANSRYAYHSVGSTIVCDVESYIKVGGMNKRKGGEDFYFLEKLAKNNKIEKIKQAKVYPSSRISHRVPFGTGPRISRFLMKKQDEYLLYSPEIFEVLKSWLKIYYAHSFLHSNIDDLLMSAKKIKVELQNFLINNNFMSDWEKILRNSKTENQILKQKDIWMDGFRTLKLIHFLRDECYPNVGMFKAINLLFEKLDITIDFVSNEKIPPVEIQIKYLEFLRKYSY